jgi:excisionase family DNA binding protein
MEKLLTANQVAEILSVTPRTVRDWLKEGRIPGIILPGGSIRFNPQVIESWIEKRTTRQRHYIK